MSSKVVLRLAEPLPLLLIPLLLTPLLTTQPLLLLSPQPLLLLSVLFMLPACSRYSMRSFAVTSATSKPCVAV
jgi:hypothetical protein